MSRPPPPQHCTSLPANLSGAGNRSLTQRRHTATGGVNLQRNPQSFPSATGTGSGYTVLTQKNHFDIKQSLHQLENEQIISLGEALGLYRSTLKKMSQTDLCGDMVAAWLRQQDNVIKRTGDPTWCVLADALDKIGLCGNAKTIREEHDIPPPVSKAASTNVSASGYQQVGVSETTNSSKSASMQVGPGIPEMTDHGACKPADLIVLEESLKKHGLTLGGKDKNALIDVGVISVETIYAFECKADFDKLCCEVTPGGKIQLEKLWIQNQPNEERLDHLKKENEGAVSHPGYQQVGVSKTTNSSKSSSMHMQVGVPEMTDHGACKPADLIVLEKSLKEYGLTLGSKDKNALIEVGVISVETIKYKADFDKLCCEVTPGGKIELEKKLWERLKNAPGNKENEGAVSHPVQEISQQPPSITNENLPTQETEQPHSIANQPTQESRQVHGKQVIGTSNPTNVQADVAGNLTTLNPGPEIVQMDRPAPTVPGSSVEDSESDDECSNSDAGLYQSDSGDDGPECDGFLKKSSYKPYPRKFKDGRQPKLKLDDNDTRKTLITPAPIKKPTDGRKCYKMKSKVHGVAVIINNKTFDKRKHKERKGTDRDEENLVETFRYLGYRVKVRRQCTKEKIERLFDSTIIQKHWIKSGDDSFVCCILSHGDDNIVYGSDSEGVPLRNEKGSIEMKLVNSLGSLLAGKPKLFFISTCRGANTGTGTTPESDATTYIPYRADFAFYYSTLPGETSWRDPTTGTYYINQLCQVLCEKASTYTLSDIQKEVTEKVKQLPKIEGCYQVPIADSENFDRNVFFFDDLVSDTAHIP